MAVFLPNGAADPEDVRITVGTTTWTNGDATATWQVYLTVDQASAFQTYFAVGPTSFGGNNYYVCFDGNGSVSDAFAFGADSAGGPDHYSNTFPKIRRWYRQAFRRVGNFEQYWFDLEAGSNLFIPSVHTAGLTFDATATMVFGSNSWTTGEEGIFGYMKAMKAWTRGLSFEDLNEESLTAEIVTARGRDQLWGQWPCERDAKDHSGRAHHLTVNGANVRFDQVPDYSSIRRPQFITPGNDMQWVRFLRSVSQGGGGVSGGASPAYTGPLDPLLARFP